MKRACGNQNPTWLPGELIQPEGAAAEVEDVVVGGYLSLEVADDRVQTFFALLLDFQQSCLTHNPQML
jgi:hypothetical protein